MRRIVQSFMMALAALLLAIPQPPAAQTVPTPSGHFLHLSDIHFDPFADPNLVRQLLKQPVDQWQAILQSSPLKQPELGPHRDSNFPLLALTLREAAKTENYDYVVLTGDYLSHGFVPQLASYTSDPAVARDFTAKTVSFVNLMIAQAFPKAPLIATLGNNDSDCNDYQLTPGADILAPVGADLPAIAGDPAALADFKAGGYYLTPHPTVPKVDFVVLSIFWSHKYLNACGNGADPAQAQLAWLSGMLAQEAASGRKAILLMHIPPGIDGFSTYHAKGAKIATQWTSDGKLLDAFVKLTGQYRAQLIGGFAGHTHMDEFRVVADNAPIVAIRVAPSVTPWDGNNPAFTVVDYDPADGSTLDYSVARYDGGQFPIEYRFSKAYGPKRYDAANLATLAQRVLKDTGTRASFGEFYATGTPTPAARAGSWQYFGCALSALRVSAYRSCLGSVNSGRARSRR